MTIKDIKLNDLFLSIDGQHSTIIKMFLAKKINFETLIILDDILGFTKRLNKDIKEKVLWPKIDNKVLLEDNIKFIIQFNGKTRKIIISKKDTSEDMLLAKIKEDNKLNEYLTNKQIKRKIFIKNKLINIIAI